MVTIPPARDRGKYPAFYQGLCAGKADIADSPLGSLMILIVFLVCSLWSLSRFYGNQLNRIKQATSNSADLNTGTNQWSAAATTQNAYKLSGVKYDGNGNIVTLNRNSDDAGVSYVMDDLKYYYNNPSGKITNNRLNYVDDLAGATAITSDIEAQASTNYGYDVLGQLIKDEEEEIGTINWNTRGAR